MRHFIYASIFLFFSITACFAESEAFEKEDLTNRLQLVPEIQVLSPSQIILKNQQFEVPYSDKLSGVFGFSFALSAPTVIQDFFQLYLVSRLGFSFTEGNYTVTQIDTKPSPQTNLQLAWIPFSVGAKSVFSIAHFPYVRPTLGVGVGTQWMHQTSSTPGLNDNFFVPFYYLSPGISFFDKQNPDDWFGGFSFGVSLRNSFASPQTVRATTFDLSINIIP